MSSVNYFKIITLQNAVTTAGNGAVASVSGYGGAQNVEIVEGQGGTATVTLQGSFDGTNWYSVGYQQIDATASPARAVIGISVTSSSKGVYQVLDQYPMLRAVVSAVTGAKITAKLYQVAG
jgi:hypothetical protein